MTEPVLKHCRKCGCDKPADREHWYFDRGKPGTPCKSCRKKSQRHRYQNDPDFSSRVRQRERERYRSDPAHRASVCEYQRQRRRDPAAKAARREFDKKRDQERLRDPNFKAWRREYLNEYSRNRYKSDPKINLDRRVGSAVRKALKKRGLSKTLSKGEILGWTIDELVVHLEALFEPGMSWENTDDWHIDHIIPLSAVKYKSQDDPLFKMVWSLSNLAPLWAADNQEKLANIQWTLPDHYKNPKLRALYEDRDYFLTIFD